MSGDSHGGGKGGSQGAHEDKFDKSKKQRETVDMLVDTIEHQHQKAYSSAVDKHLLNDKKQVDYDKLKETDVQKKFVDSMVEHYVTVAKEKLGVDPKKKLAPEEESMLLNAYAGITREELGGLVRRHKNRFSHQTFKGLIGDNQEGLRANIRNRLMPTAYAHFEDSDVEGIAKHMDAKLEKLDPSKMTLEQAVNLLQNYHANDGQLAKGAYEGQIYHKKKEAHKEPAGAKH